MNLIKQRLKDEYPKAGFYDLTPNYMSFLEKHATGHGHTHTGDVLSDLLESYEPTRIANRGLLQSSIALLCVANSYIRAHKLGSLIPEEVAIDMAIGNKGAMQEAQEVLNDAAERIARYSL